MDDERVIPYRFLVQAVIPGDRCNAHQRVLEKHNTTLPINID